MSAPKQPTPKHGSGHQHPAELRERAVRMVQETMKETGERHGVVTRIAVQLGLGSETLRHWVKQAEIDGGQRPGITTNDQERIAELEKEVRELRRANERSSRRRRLSSRGSSTLDCRSSELHQGTPGKVRGRADLRYLAGRPVYLLRRSLEATLRSAGARRGTQGRDFSCAPRELRSVRH